MCEKDNPHAMKKTLDLGKRGGEGWGGGGRRV